MWFTKNTMNAAGMMGTDICVYRVIFVMLQIVYV